jgi:hypothetical protein
MGKGFFSLMQRVYPKEEAPPNNLCAGRQVDRRRAPLPAASPEFTRFSGLARPLRRPPAMSQRSVEVVIGRLATNEDLRRQFRVRPEETLRELVAQGLELTPTEVASILACGRRCVEAIAGSIDPRLDKASLDPECSCTPPIPTPEQERQGGRNP